MKPASSFWAGGGKASIVFSNSGYLIIVHFLHTAGKQQSQRRTSSVINWAFSCMARSSLLFIFMAEE
jgi:hypothetical protein